MSLGLVLDLPKRVEFAMDIARGMACLHAQRPIIIHRDLKTANLLVSARFEIKVADFGLSRIKDASHVSYQGYRTRLQYSVVLGAARSRFCSFFRGLATAYLLCHMLQQRTCSRAQLAYHLQPLAPCSFK